MRNRQMLFSALLVVSAALAPPAMASNTAAHWRALTEIDVEAAHALLRNNHPAVVPETGDKTFVSSLDTAYRRARSRAATVTNYPGYVATLGEFANSMGDGHIWSHPLYVPNILQWAGMIVAKRGSNWVVSKVDKDVTGDDLAGARIVSCGGVPVDNFAAETLGRFQRVWSVEAMRVLAAPRLLVDEGNPFVHRPDTCVMELGGQQRSVTLHWTNTTRAKFVPLLADVTGQAGYGIRSVGQAYWIAIQLLTVKAQAVVDAARTQQDQLRNSPYVVIDLRGNGGGDDAYGRKLADILYGTDYVTAKLGPAEGDSTACPDAWRASAENINATDAQAEEFDRTGETMAARGYREAVVAMRAALAAHRPLTANPNCKPPEDRLVPNGVVSLMHGRVIVLTDSVCFSSCIDVVEFFRTLGATLAGQTTGADTHYSEVREITLPSGLSTFSTLRAIMTGAPRDIGPFVPDYPFDGDISDTAALEKWVAETVTPAPGGSH